MDMHVYSQADATVNNEMLREESQVCLCQSLCTLSTRLYIYNLYSSTAGLTNCCTTGLANICSAVFFRQSSSAFSKPCGSISHRSPMRLQVLFRTILSTMRSFRISEAKASVLASLGKYLPLYGSSLSFTIRSRALVSSTCRSTWSGSSGSGDVATPAQ